MKAFLLAGAVLSLSSGPEEMRAVWVTRFEYRTEADIRTIVANSASLGFNTVLFQVRGQADAYYRSELEPWADCFDGRDPGFDPLEVACREARRHKLALHAWVNVMPAWKGTTPPADRTHVWWRHPDWVVAGRNGKRQALNDHYTCLNPCLPAVREHLVEVVRDLATRYPVDGVHLDYVRFIEGDWSYDRKTLALFGKSPEKSPAAWAAFRRDAVTRTVEAMRKAVKEARPAAMFSAAVYPTAAARARVLQDAEDWVRRGLVDAVFPMTYSADDFDFRAEIGEGYDLFRAGGAAACIPGVGAYKHDTPGQTVRQMQMCRAGFAVFSYSSLFVSPDAQRREDAALCRARREAVREALGVRVVRD